MTSAHPETVGAHPIPMRPFTASLPMALLRARDAAMRIFRPLLAEHDLTDQQWRVLRALAAAEDGLDAGDLADRTSLLAPSLSRILANLESRGLTDRTTHDHDQRRARISLSADGHALVTLVAPSSEAAYNRIEREFGADRLRDLLAELHALAALDMAAREPAEEAS